MTRGHSPLFTLCLSKHVRNQAGVLLIQWFSIFPAAQSTSFSVVGCYTAGQNDLLGGSGSLFQGLLGWPHILLVHRSIQRYFWSNQKLLVYSELTSGLIRSSFGMLLWAILRPTEACRVSCQPSTIQKRHWELPGKSFQTAVSQGQHHHHYFRASSLHSLSLLLEQQPSFFGMPFLVHCALPYSELSIALTFVTCRNSWILGGLAVLISCLWTHSRLLHGCIQSRIGRHIYAQILLHTETFSLLTCHTYTDPYLLNQLRLLQVLQYSFSQLLPAPSAPHSG